MTEEGLGDRPKVSTAEQHRRLEDLRRLRLSSLTEHPGYIAIPIGSLHGDVLFVDSTGTWARLKASTVGFILKTNNIGADPEWVDPLSLALKGQSVTFTATSNYTYNHGRGQEPVIQVFDGAGRQVEVCVRHPTSDTVSLNFNGTITNGTLVLN